jgi:hypothetical protein
MVPTPGEPPDLVATGKQFDFSTVRLEQSRRFEGALPASDDGDALTAEVREITMVDRVRNVRRWEVRVLRRTPREVGDPGRNDNPLGLDALAVGELNSEAVLERLNRSDGPFIDVRHHRALEPVPVIDEARQRYGTRKRRLALCVKVVERVFASRVGQVARVPRGAKKHPLWHPLLPEGHRGAEHADVQAVGRAQVRGDGEPVRPRANDCDTATSGACAPTPTLVSPRDPQPSFSSHRTQVGMQKACVQLANRTVESDASFPGIREAPQVVATCRSSRRYAAAS